MTVTLTLDMPSDLAEQVHALPPATLNRLVVAALPGVLGAAYEDDFDDPEDRDMSELPPLPAILTEPLHESLRKGFEAADAGQVIDGEAFLARLRQRTGRA